MKIIKNPNWTEEQHNKLALKIAENGGFCLCKIGKIPENKCMCKEFIESQELGECHCGKFIKTEI